MCWWLVSPRSLPGELLRSDVAGAASDQFTGEYSMDRQISSADGAVPACRAPRRFLLRRTGRVLTAAAVLAIGIGAPGTSFAGTTPVAAPAGDPAVISEWNAIAVATLAGDATTQPIEDILYTAFVQAAVYNAVVGVEGRYAPYRFHAHAPRGASAVSYTHLTLPTTPYV